ncbi:choice-of-anchor R domain-containing protein [Candidatus Palauibacter sp.]|uniref:choice-of-anchor R domain-containing protein n=1 Tax=Candidatus Palauibacter sp. TaxID=3101350 RepID=UPI003B593612
MHALLVTLALLLPPGVAQAQEISLVSNITESHTGLQNVFPPDYTIGTIELGEKRNAQRFTTGSNPAGYTLQSVVLNLLEGSGTGQVVRVAIHDDGSSGNPGTLLAVLDSPADPIGDNSGTAGNRTFAAPSALSLNADTEYWVVVSNTTTDNSYFDISVTNSNNETTAHGFSIRDSRHGGTPGSWLEDNNTKLRMEVRGTVVIPTGLEVTLHLSDNEPHEDLLAVTVTATASPASPVAFTVEISASPVAPATDDDFELSTNRTLSFAANATGSTGTVRISPVSDEDPEPNDVVKVSGVVSNPAIPNPDDVRLTILNDDADLPQDIAIDAPAAVDEGAGTANVTVTLTTRQNTAPVIDAQLFYRQRPGTATRGDDYTRPQGLGNRIAIVPVSEFSANADGTAWVARHSFEIGIVDDGEAEADETIVFEIYIISDNRGTEQTIVIRDDDTPPAVSIAAANPTVLEEQPAVFTLSRTGATGSALTVTVALTEQADRDVLPDGAATQRTVTFARGSSTAALTVELENDDLTEPDGDLTAAVRAGAGYTVGDPSTATVTVVDDDGPTAPVIEDIEVVSTPRLRWRNSREEDTYGEGENIRIEVRFDQTVHVEGEPAMALEVGDPCGSVCEARYESGSGTNTLVFAYLVLVVDLDRNGVAIPANPIGESIDKFDGFSIRNDWDQEARLSYRREGTKSGHRVDGTRQAAPYLSVEDAEAHEADGEMAFTVRLEPHGLGIVTVEYATRDGSGDTGAKAGLDYTETSGTLRFNPLETERTVTVPIIDDDEEDDGETFTLRLSNPDGARLRDGDRAARGTIRNSDPAALSASFPASAFASASHSGADDRPQVVVAFSEPVAEFGADTRSVSVTGGTVASVQPHAEDGLENAWVFFLVPDGGGDVTFALVADAACASGGICTAGGKVLTQVPAASTIPGPEPGPPPPLTAEFRDMPETHDGESAFTFRIAFSEPLSWMNGRRLREDVVAVAGGRATSASRVNRRRDLWELTLEPDSPSDVTVTVAAGAACGTPAAVCTKDGRALSETISATVEGPVNTTVPRITAVQVTSVPKLERDTYGLGETIRFTVSFSEQVEVTGRPHFTFSLGNRSATRRVDAPYESGSGTAALVFGYVVQEGDEDNNGIFLVDGDALGRAGPVALDAGEAIAALGGGVDADLSSSVRGTERDHKVDGSRAPAASAPMREDLAARACSALAGGDGLAPGRAAAALWRDGDMDSDQLAALDDMGNGNGTYDLGDLLAWINRCRPGSGSADGAGPPPSAPPAMPASQPAREASQRRKGARGPARRRRAAADPPTAGSRTRRSGWLRTALLAVVTLAWGCGDGIVGPRADTPGHDAVGAAFTDPGPLQVRLTAPPRARDIGAMLVIEGPAIDSVQAPGLEIFETDESSSMRREVVIAGALPPDAPVLRVWVPHRGDEARYRVSLLQVAAEDFTLGDPEDYAVAIGR